MLLHMKVLLFSDLNHLANIGGPIGYQYNIAEYLKDSPNTDISFLNGRWTHFSLMTKIGNYSISLLKKLFKKNKIISFSILIYDYFFRKYQISKNGIDFLESFDAIHIHSLPLFLQYFSRNKVDVKLILTSHTPEPVIDQLFKASGYGAFLANHPKFRDYLLTREIEAFDLCDRIMFPVKQAREPYIEASSLYSEAFKRLDSKFFYIPTALYSVDKVQDCDNVLDEYNIPHNSLRVCYIGRHNQIKGYDFLQKAAKFIWKEESNVYFIIGGKQEPLKGLEDERWIELGWVNTPKLLNEIDVFILPNKHTYFDLILLEVLRQGTPVILSRTGGNKWFEGKNVSGLKFFEYGNESELSACVRDFSIRKEKGELDDIKKEIADFFREEFSMSLYIQRYMEHLYNICS